jgi:hypothetical protein
VIGRNTQPGTKLVLCHDKTERMYLVGLVRWAPRRCVVSSPLGTLNEITTSTDSLFAEPRMLEIYERHERIRSLRARVSQILDALSIGWQSAEALPLERIDAIEAWAKTFPSKP